MEEKYNTVSRLSPGQALHVDEIYARFELSWKALPQGRQPPSIEEYLGNTPGLERLVLLRDLVLLDIDYRRKRGEEPSIKDYHERFPELVGVEESTVCYVPVKPTMRSDRYVVTKFHARGGLGEVWKAHDPEIGRTVAVKRLRNERDGEQERFLVEAQITGQLEHPGIVPVHDLGTDEKGQPFYVMTFIHGTTLKKAIDEYHAPDPKRQEPKEVQLCRLLENFVKICQTVAFAHSRGVIHRDLKPDNVMLGAYGETLVIDWGLAKLRDQPENPAYSAPVRVSYGKDYSATQAGMFIGSPAYMAPEVAEGHAVTADERTDLYLLGATLYAILTGRPPRVGSSHKEVIEQARKGPPPPPRQVKSDIPRALEAICLKAMAPRKQDRYAGALDLAADIQRYLAGTPVAAYKEPLTARAWRWCKRHRRVLVQSVLAAVALLGMVSLGLMLSAAQREAEDAKRRAEELRRTEQARKDFALFRRLADERQFHSGLSMPSGERNLQFDSHRGEAAGQEALKVANSLKAEDALPAADKEAFYEEFRSLLLLTVQAQAEEASGPAAVRGLLELLDRAADLKEPSRGLYGLRAMCFKQQGEKEMAFKAVQRARALPETALDHFLEGERLRTEAHAPYAAGSATLDWKPNADHLARAIDEYHKALQENPEHFWCYFQLGRCYLSLGKGAEALEALGTCVALRPKQPWGYSARGLALGLMGRFEEGKADLDRVLALEKDFSPALLNRGILSKLQKKYEDALADFDKVLALPAGKRLIEAAYYRGQLYLERGELPKAQADFEQVVKENRGFRPVYLSLAQLHFQEGKQKQGLASLTTYLDLARPTPFDPRNPELFAQRGQLLRQLVPTLPGARAARGELESAVARGGKSPELFYRLGWLLENMGKPKEALENYTKALKAEPANDLRIKVLNQRGWVYAAQPAKYAEAKEDFAQSVLLDPKNSEAHTGLGYLLARTKKPAEAQREASWAMLDGYGDYLVLHNVACIYAELSGVEQGQTTRHKDMAMTFIQREVELWRKGGTGPHALTLIRNEPSFAALRSREDFKKLLRENP